MDREKQVRGGLSTESLTFWAPWPGIASILIILTCAVSAAVIVSVSNDNLVEEWNIKPAVLLAILSATSNIAFSTALATGITVQFWLHATCGTLLTQLHYIWDHGRGIGLIRALRAGSEARRVAIIATLCYFLQFATVPLFQRSTYQISQDQPSNTTIFLDLSSRIPDGWFGLMQDGQVVAGRRAMSQAQGWYRNATIKAKNEPGYTCDGGTCVGSVRGAGFTHTCRPLPAREIDLLDSNTDDESVFLIKHVFTEDSNGTPVINLTTLYIDKVEGKCMATLKGDVCEITTATIEYPIIIQNSTVSLRYYDLDKVTTVATYQSASDSLTAPTGTPAGPLVGLKNFLRSWLAVNSTKQFNTAANKTLYTSEGWGSDLFFQAEPWDYGNHSLIQCGLTWNSPTEYVLKAMHDFMFRVALKTGNGTEQQSFDVRKTASKLVFRSEYRYLGAALASTACCLVLVSNLVWGWWQLDRKVTLSPLETARAIGSSSNGPLFRRVGSDGTIEDILEAVAGVEFKLSREYNSGGGGETTTHLVSAKEMDNSDRAGEKGSKESKTVHYHAQGAGPSD